MKELLDRWTTSPLSSSWTLFLRESDSLRQTVRAKFPVSSWSTSTTMAEDVIENYAYLSTGIFISMSMQFVYHLELFIDTCASIAGRERQSGSIIRRRFSAAKV